MKLFGKKDKNTPLPPKPARQSSQRPVFSYYAGKADKETSLKQERRTASQPSMHRYTRIRQLPVMLAVLAVLTGLFYNLTLSRSPKISLRQNNSNAVLKDARVYQRAAEKILSDSWKSHSKLTVDIQLLRQMLKAQFPEIQEVTIRLPLAGRRPVISITPAIPSVLLSGNSGTYVLDEQGRAIMAAQEALSPELTELPLLRDDSGLDIEIGRGVLPKQTVQYVQAVLAQLQAKGVRAESLTLPALANEFHLRVKDQPYYVKFNTAADPLQSAGTFLAVKERLENAGQIPQEYIDVRIEERTYYK